MKYKNLVLYMKQAISRRDFLKLLKVVGLQLMVWAFGVDLVLNEFDADELDVKKVKLILPHLPNAFSGFRLVQISDIHIGGWTTAEKLMQVVDVILKQSPDAIAITGDFAFSTGSSRFSTSLSELEVMSAQLKRLSDNCLTVSTLGNHDLRFGDKLVRDALFRAGVEDLKNTTYTIERSGHRLHFSGVDDVMYGRARLDLVTKRIPENECAILLAHEPDYADTSAATKRFDLQISGHSHGGQVNIPLFGPPILPHLAHKYPRGLYQVGEMLQYTNRGIGMTPPFVRFNCPPEITVFTLQSPEK